MFRDCLCQRPFAPRALCLQYRVVMGLAFAASPTCPGASLRRATLSDCSQRLLRGSHAVVRSAAGASLPPGRVVLAADRAQQQSPGRLGAQAGNGAERGVDVARERSTVATAAAMATSLPATEQVVAPAGAVVKAPVVKPVRRPEPVFVPVPEDVITDFEHKLEADLQVRAEDHVSTVTRSAARGSWGGGDRPLALLFKRFIWVGSGAETPALTPADVRSPRAGHARAVGAGASALSGSRTGII